ncbi:type III PLP-dependent enzyme [Halobacillus litoralis]|uniref:type III PLP-dependent enzyme n=1 Tax=Halobacillus litoralis TaxID=45668 RepID=UPI001CFE2057|nr:type III PLP-dependent enzyme [Halobacillus litoralis]
MTIEQYIETTMKESSDPVCAYVYDLNQLRRHAETLKQSLPSFCRLFYAVKANPDQRVLETLGPIVDGFEAASEGEIRKAGRIGSHSILFGAPGKKDREIEAAIRKEVEYINIESFHDLNRVNEIAGNMGAVLPVLIRVNLRKDVPESHHMMAGTPTQFGVDEEDLPLLIQTAEKRKNLVIHGFHFHAMSNNLDAEKHMKFIQTCVEKTKAWREKYNLEVKVVDVGGGVGINYWNPSEPFNWEELAAGITNFEAEMDGLKLILELGRFMTAGCGSYVTEVLDVKTNHQRPFALIRGGSHHLRLPAAWKMSHPFRIHKIEGWRYSFERPGVRQRAVTIAGELCTPNDVLVREQPVEELRAGDVIIFEYAGAYAWTISHHEFLSHPHPDMVYIDRS